MYSNVSDLVVGPLILLMTAYSNLFLRDLYQKSNVVSSRQFSIIIFDSSP